MLDNLSPHLSTKKEQRVVDWAAATNVEFAYTPFYGSWLNRIEAQFQAPRYSALDGTDHPTHRAQASMGSAAGSGDRLVMRPGRPAGS